MEEVQGVVKWANDTGTPFVPVSSGPPRFRGDTVPGVGGVAIVDLGEMKQIVRIDAKNKVALIEPGVTFGPLIEALKEEGLAPYLPLVPNSSKSVPPLRTNFPFRKGWRWNASRRFSKWMTFSRISDRKPVAPASADTRSAEILTALLPRTDAGPLWAKQGSSS